MISDPTCLEENIRNKFVNLADELEVFVIREVLESKFALGSVARIGLSQNSMTITRDDLASLESGPDVVLDLLVRRFLTDLGLHLAKPDENLLVGETVKRTSKTIKGSTIGEERVRQSGTDKFAGVGRNVTALMVTECRVNGITRRAVNRRTCGW